VTNRRRNLIYVALFAVPVAAAVGWWYYWPQYRLAQAERAAAAGEWGRAAELVRPLTEDERASKDALLLGGRALRKLGRLDEAEKLLSRAAHQSPDEHALRRELALTRADRHYSPVVERFLLLCLQKDSKDAEVLTALARGQVQAHHWDDADEYYSRALEQRPDDTPLRLERGHTRLTAASAFQQGHVADAAADFLEVLRRHPDHYEARLYLAHCLVADARMRDARPLLEVCRRQAPDRVEPLIGLAACALEENEWEDADRLLRAAAERDPRSSYVLTMQGDLALRRGHYEEAAGYFRRVLDLEPRDAPARLKLAQALRALDQPVQAEAELREYERLTRAKESSSTETGARNPR
jgi:tetratricopeptide (TPR) repeat protein